MSDEPDVSILLDRARSGDEQAHGELFNAINDDLRQLAGNLMRQERKDHTLQASALVNEAYVRMCDQGIVQSAENRRYLFGAANRVMRQILVDHARSRSAKKRGGEAKRNALDVVIDNFETNHATNFLDLDEALDKLGAESPRQREVVELKFFSGLTIEQTAELLGCSHGTVEGDWKLAKAKLYRWLNGDS